ncbi:MAG TPA: serine/threonine-protein kinase [Gemmatimonadaceae bacterium]|nr:serine/threonine-protein kinase [Gemmatimonadaceae bacterium]
MAESASPEFLALQQALAGRYSLVSEIGRGGMGVVYLARDVALDRPVAIKLLPPAMANDAELRERFLREAQTAAQLSHPNIVPVHLVEERDGSIYFVMSLVEGESLGERVRRAGPLAAAEVIRLLQEVAWALGYAHGRGVVHRDIKPDNILLERGSGRALLTDFGIARSLNAGNGTTPGMILGTLQYIAPEQAGGDAVVDGRADLYSLGVTAFFALTGRLPFDATGGAKLIAAHMFEPAPPVASLAPSIPPRLAEIVDRALLKDPTLRWQTGEQLADALVEINNTAPAMPPSIRRFVTTVTTALGQLALIVLSFELAFVMMFDQLGTIAKLFAVMAFVPLFPILEAARAVAIAGYSFNDVQSAIAADSRASDGYTQYLDREMKRSAKLAQSRVGRVIMGVLGASLLATGVVLLVTQPTVWAWWKLALKLAIGIPALWMGVTWLGFAAGIEPYKSRVGALLGVSGDPAKNFKLAAWRSAPVRALLALGRLVTRTLPRKPVATQSNEPTEVLLAAAAEDVFAGLGADDRKAAREVPGLIRSLEKAAAGLRARLAALDQGIAAVGDVSGSAKRAQAVADMRAERDRAGERLRSTVEAMENLRLDLLKLRAGVANPGELTAAIESAQRVGEGIAYTLKGRAEVSEIA